ncbi:MAG TPA: FtsX-like permease family protein [Longimicrobiales bacterium]|nr:FtsX-like permease family protein [Longimicrobiales bacterium]
MASGDESPWLQVVGVIDDVQFRDPTEDVRPAWYVPLSQLSLSFGAPGRRFNVAVRTALDQTVLADPVRAVIRDMDAALPVIQMRPLDTVVSQAVAGPRFTMTVLGLFATLALVLGAIGIYGVLAYAVARRMREFGIRIALGADWRELSALVLGEGVRMVALGLALGIAGASLRRDSSTDWCSV